MDQKIYRNALHHAMYLAIKHVWLWPFGVFAAFLGHSGLMPILSSLGFYGEGNLGVRMVTLAQQLFAKTPAAADAAISWTSYLSAIWIGIFLLIIFGFILFVSVTSQGAIVHAAQKFISHSRKELHPANASWHIGVKHSRSIFAINVLKWIALAVISYLVWFAQSKVALSMDMLSQFTYILVVLFAIISGAFVSFYSMYAVCYSVIEELPLVAALKESFSLTKKHLLVSFEAGFTIMLLEMLFAGVAVALFYILMVPAVSFFIFGLLLGSTALVEFVVLLSVILYVIALMLVGGVFIIFSTTAWTYLFMKMRSTGIVSHLKKLFLKKR